MSEGFFDELRPKLPFLIGRKDVKKYFGDIISAKYLANLDSMNKGPAKVYISRKVFYKRDDFIAWIEARMSDNIDL